MQTNYNLDALFNDVTLSKEAHGVAFCGSTLNALEFKRFGFQEERVQSAVRGIWCVTAERKTSCISECLRRPFAHLHPLLYIQQSSQRAGQASSVLTHTNNMPQLFPEKNTNMHTLNTLQVT